ncbi:MAG TPA: hypothetical protein VGC38_00030 [Pseudolabrys sp.]
MVTKKLRAGREPTFAASARAYALDLAASVLMFLSVSIVSGRVWRFPFDDEIYTLGAIERLSGAKLFAFYLGGADVHPPLQYLFASGLYHLGLSEAGMRLCSLAMTAIALTLFHLLALMAMARRDPGAVSPFARLIAVLLFGLCALAVSQGDAIRWYPLFAMLIAVFVTLYLAGGNDMVRLAAAVPLGLAASTNYLTIIVILPLAIYRYGLQRRFNALFDAEFWAVFLLFAAIGIYSAFSLFAHHADMVGTQIGNGAVRSALTNMLGFFGGHVLGIGQIWIVAPAAAISVWAAISQIDRHTPADPVHLLLLLLAASALMILPGFAKPRSFLYLAPVLAAVLALSFNREVKRAPGVALLLAALWVAASVGAIANINGGTHPFKRNSVIPYQDIVDFIDSNGTGRQLIVSTDPIIPWVLRGGRGREDRCASYFAANKACLDAVQRYDSVVVISGHSDKSENPQAMQGFDGAVAAVVAGRRKVATMHAGIDDDAALKTRLTGVALDKYILTVELYR